MSPPQGDTRYIRKIFLHKLLFNFFIGYEMFMLAWNYILDNVYVQKRINIRTKTFQFACRL